MARKTAKEIAQEQHEKLMAELVEDLAPADNKSDDEEENTTNSAEESDSLSMSENVIENTTPEIDVSAILNTEIPKSNGTFLHEDDTYYYYEAPIDQTFKHEYNHFRTRVGEEKDKLLNNIKSLGYLLEKPTAEIDSSGKFGITKGWNRRNCWSEIGNETITVRVSKSKQTIFDTYTDLYSDNKVNKTISPSEDFELFLRAYDVIITEFGMNSRNEVNGGLYNHMLKFGYEVTKSKRLLGIKNNLTEEWQQAFICDLISQNASVALSKLTKSTQKAMFELNSAGKLNINTSNIKIIKSADQSRGPLSKEDIENTVSQKNWIEKGVNIRLPKLSDEHSDILKEDFSDHSFEDAFMKLLESYIQLKEGI